jgi:hypothetical protein
MVQVFNLAVPLIERGRPGIALARIERGLPFWRSRAVEPDLLRAWQ